MANLKKTSLKNISSHKKSESDLEEKKEEHPEKIEEARRRSDTFELGERLISGGHVTIPRFYRSNKQQCQNISFYSGEQKVVCPRPPFHLANDSLNTEFLYYMGAIKDLLPAMSVYGDRIKVLPWLKKLFAPEYQASRLRLKRNKYLLHLTLVMMNDRLYSVFQNQPVLGKLMEINQLRPEVSPLARWEKDTYWDELIKDLKQADSEMKCSFHEDCGENEGDQGAFHPIAGSLLDQEFRFFLYLVRPLVALIPHVKQRAVCSIWVLTLAKVRTCSCLTMKAIRNDYMQALMGYLQELRLVGPFNKLPPEDGTTLKPLAEVADPKNPYAFLTKSVTNPTSEEAEEFMQHQPIPESGAFCYIAVTGNANEPNKVTSVPMSVSKFDNYFKH